MSNEMASSQNHNADSQSHQHVQEIEGDRLRANHRASIDVLKVEFEPERSARVEVRSPGTEGCKKDSPGKDRTRYKRYAVLCDASSSAHTVFRVQGSGTLTACA